MAGDGDSMIHPRDAEEIDPPPPPKKPKTEEDAESKAEAAETRPHGSFYFRGKLLRKGERDDLECDRQQDLFYKQLEESECFDVDWDSFDYIFAVVNFDWEPLLEDDMSNQELIQLLIHKAIEEHDETHETKLEFVKYVSANIVSVKGLLYYITFTAKDLKSSNQELPKPYQAKVWKFGDEISVELVRAKANT
ncbi:unnamed protein product [Cochlearia groenlandica]